MWNWTVFQEKTRKTLTVYWELVRITVPISIAAKVLQDIGFIEAIAPFFEPLMTLVGLPNEFALVWLTTLVVGLWGGLVIVFSLVPVSALTTADMTVLSALLLLAHAIPIEQKIIQKAGPGLMISSTLRIGGAFVFAAILHQIFAVTGWLSTPLKPAWVPTEEGSDWMAFLWSTVETLGIMLVVLLALSWLMDLLKYIGAIRLMNRVLAPLFRLIGIQSQALPFTAVGLLLGISYGAGLLISEARDARLEPRQVFLACVFMGFAHSIIEDTLLVVAFGADFTSVFFGRLAFAALATALIARAYKSMPVGDVTSPSPNP